MEKRLTRESSDRGFASKPRHKKGLEIKICFLRSKGACTLEFCASVIFGRIGGNKVSKNSSIGLEEESSKWIRKLFSKLSLNGGSIGLYHVSLNGYRSMEYLLKKMVNAYVAITYVRPCN